MAGLGKKLLKSFKSFLRVLRDFLSRKRGKSAFKALKAFSRKREFRDFVCENTSFALYFRAKNDHSMVIFGVRFFKEKSHQVAIRKIESRPGAIGTTVGSTILTRPRPNLAGAWEGSLSLGPGVSRGLALIDGPIYKWRHL